VTVPFVFDENLSLLLQLTIFHPEINKIPFLRIRPVETLPKKLRCTLSVSIENTWNEPSQISFSLALSLSESFFLDPALSLSVWSRR